jgi:hypothetical protein
VPAEVRCAKVLHRFAHEIEDARGIILKRLAVAVERYGASVAFEQRFAHQIFKSADLLADGGLRQMHALGGAREALGLRDRNEAAQKIWRQVIYHESL